MPASPPRSATCRRSVAFACAHHERSVDSSASRPTNGASVSSVGGNATGGTRHVVVGRGVERPASVSAASSFGRRRRHQVGRAQLRDLLLARHPGEREAADVVQGDAVGELVGDQLGGGMRQEHLPTARQPTDARRAAHRGTEIVALLLLRFAGVHAGAHREADAVRETAPRRARAGTQSRPPRHRSPARTRRACCHPRPASAASDRRAPPRSRPRARDDARSPPPSRSDAPPRGEWNPGCR